MFGGNEYIRPRPEGDGLCFVQDYTERVGLYGMVDRRGSGTWRAYHNRRRITLAEGLRLDKLPRGTPPDPAAYIDED